MHDKFILFAFAFAGSCSVNVAPKKWKHLSRQACETVGFHVSTRGQICSIAGPGTMIYLTNAYVLAFGTIENYKRFILTRLVELALPKCGCCVFLSIFQVGSYIYK